ncbi:Transposase [Paracoccus alcaliphilus]|uniref:Transposase n=1 Tax=Paracoccus alcaliphilus TaxID=34002 RepID=A0A1H8P123_9RHOB|nr:transposase [Paracoccus alcaliphilus]SEO35630.1 Transposase [Paracoccus alcaliphilus]
MERFVLTDAQWAKMEPHCLGKPTDPGRSGSDNRRFLEAVLWVVRTGSPWRDLPAFFGNWNTVFKRYRDWVKADVFIRLFEAEQALLRKRCFGYSSPFLGQTYPAAIVVGVPRAV